MGKALHLLAPQFFPPWDNAIAKTYGYTSIDPPGSYVRFCVITREFAACATTYSGITEQTVVKRIDEYNYARYTKGWVRR